MEFMRWVVKTFAPASELGKAIKEHENGWKEIANKVNNATNKAEDLSRAAQEDRKLLAKTIVEREQEAKSYALLVEAERQKGADSFAAFREHERQQDEVTEKANYAAHQEEIKAQYLDIENTRAFIATLKMEDDPEFYSSQQALLEEQIEMLRDFELAINPLPVVDRANEVPK